MTVSLDLLEFFAVSHMTTSKPRVAIMRSKENNLLDVMLIFAPDMLMQSNKENSEQIGY